MLSNHKIRHINILAFIILAYFYLTIANDDLLYTWQEYSVFIKGKTFMEEMLRTHGFFAWVGSFLTQFFYYPWLGSTMLIGIWVATYYLMTDTFKLKDEYSTIALMPLVCSLISIIEVGYWIYYIDTPGYCFSNSIILLLASLTMWVSSKIINLTCKNAKSSMFKELCTRIILSIIGYAVISICSFSPDGFVHGDYSPFILMVPFIGIKASLFLLALPYDLIKIKNPVAIGIMGGVFGLYGAIANYFNVSDNNFHSELRMYRAIDESRYEDVITEFEENAETPTNLMVLYKNIALMHTNRLPEMFKFNNCGTQPNADKDFHIRIAQISGEMMYYQFGQINYAYRWAIENSVKHGMTNARLKMLARCAIFNQEFDVAHKYLTLLKATTFHSKWAKEHEGWIVRNSNLLKSNEYQNISPLLNEDLNFLDKDNGLCEKWILNHFSDLLHPTSPKVEDLIMCTSLWTEDEYSFLVHFYDYYQKHSTQPIPSLYQEALILLSNSEDSPITLNDFPFDNKIIDLYNSFASEYQSYTQQGMKAEEIGKKLKPVYGNTYWWYYYFYSDFNIY